MVIDGHFIIKLYLKRITMFDSEFIKNQMGLEMSVMLVKGSMMFYVSCPSWHVKKWNGIFVCLLSILSWMGLYRENLARIGAVLELHFDRFLWFPNWLGVSDDWDYSKKNILVFIGKKYHTSTVGFVSEILRPKLHICFKERWQTDYPLVIWIATVAMAHENTSMIRMLIDLAIKSWFSSSQCVKFPASVSLL